MKDVFYEETASVQDEKKEALKFNIMNVLSIMFFIVSAIWLVFSITLYELSGNVLWDIIGIVGPELIFISSAILFFYFK